MAQVAQEVATKFPPNKHPVHFVFANAGYGGPPLLDGTPEALQKQVDVLTMGVIWTFKAFQERCLAQKEHCAWVGTSSVAGIMPSGGSYGVGKHGCLAVMESLKEELLGKKATHITCHVLCPGVVNTNFFIEPEKSYGAGDARA